MGLFAGINEAESSKGGNYIKVGKHLMQVAELKAFVSRKKENFFIAELEVLESDSHRIGERVSWMCNLTKHDAALGNVKAFLAALFSKDEADVDEESAEKCVGDDNPCAGMQVNCNAFNIETRAGNDFTKCEWSPVS